MRRCLASLLVFLVAFIASEARAGSCTPGQSPFTDVPDGSIFCSEALWLRNANVTLGCGNGTTYCPADPVSRAQMALFMKRLARAVTPDIMFSEAFGGTSGNLDVGLAACVTNTYSIPATGDNIRIMSHAIGTVSIQTNGLAEMSVGIEFSVDGGPFNSFGNFPPRVVVPTNQWTVVPVIAGQTMTDGSGAILVPGSTYQWRIRMQRVGGSTSDVVNSRCQLMIHLPVDATIL